MYTPNHIIKSKWSLNFTYLCLLVYLCSNWRSSDHHWQDEYNHFHGIGHLGIDPCSKVTFCSRCPDRGLKLQLSSEMWTFLCRRTDFLRKTLRIYLRLVWSTCPCLDERGIYRLADLILEGIGDLLELWRVFYRHLTVISIWKTMNQHWKWDNLNLQTLLVCHRIHLTWLFFWSLPMFLHQSELHQNGAIIRHRLIRCLD